MRQWPDATWEAIAAFFQLVEETGKWPEALRGGLICLLPKNGVQASAENPLDARPVVLLAQLYRIWASARAPDLARWMVHHKISPVSPEAGVTSAEDLAILAAGLLEEADVTGRCAALLAIDLSKAYDRLPLDLIAELVRTSGIHSAIGGPMLHMAHGWRRIKV